MPSEPTMPISLAPPEDTSANGSSTEPSSLRARLGLLGVARRTLGICLLLTTVFLWTLSNFLASTIFSDDTYSKPFFVVYVNTSTFAVSLIPMFVRFVWRNGVPGLKGKAVELVRALRSPHRGGRAFSFSSLVTKASEANGGDDAGERLLAGEDEEEGAGSSLEAGVEAMEEEDASAEGQTKANASEGEGEGEGEGEDGKLTFEQTARLSLEFCGLWFLANYFASVCLQWTSVASATILTSTSSVWTLLFCALAGVDAFSLRKLAGVLASLAGVALVYTVDMSGASDDSRGTFPHKSREEMALGDLMAFFSAVIYGIYVTVMKRKVGNEDRVNMPLFFGLVGLFNVVLMWPLFFVMHWVGLETFELPPTGRIWSIIALNSFSSLVSDMAWAYAMLLTTPLIVTVGLSLTIPLSLFGEMIQYSQYPSWVYWAGACIVLISFLFINHESTEDDRKEGARDLDAVEIA